MFFTDFSIHKNKTGYSQRTKPVVSIKLFADVYITYSNYLVTRHFIGESQYFVFGLMLGDIKELLTAGDYNNYNGNFLLVKVKDENIHILTNRLNTMHCYYSSTGIHTFFHNAIPDDRTLDWTGLKSYFSNGFFSNDRTFVNEVKLILNASEYIFNKNIDLISKDAYWRFTHQISNRTYTECIDEFARILDDIRMDYIQVDGSIAMPISGGLDSRTMTGLFSQSNEDRMKLWCYSYGFGANSSETRIAEQVAKKRHLKFERIATQNYLKEKISLIQNCVEHFQYIDGTRQADISEKLQQNARYVMCAHWGDVWHDTMGYTAEYSLKEYALKKVGKNGSDWFLNAFDGIKDYDYTEELQGSLDNDSEDKDFAIKIFKTLQWSQRWTLASTRMFQAGAFPIYPFYDNRIVDYFCTVPSIFVEKRKMQIDYLKRYHPDLAEVKWEQYNSNLYWYKIVNNRNLLYRTFRKIQRVASNKRRISRNWELFYLNEEGKEMLHNNILDNEVLCRIVPKRKLESFYQQFYRDPNASNGYTMSMLHTFSLFLNKYF